MNNKGPQMGICLACSREEKMTTLAGAKLVRDEVRRGSNQNLEFSKLFLLKWEASGMERYFRMLSLATLGWVKGHLQGMYKGPKLEKSLPCSWN